MLEEAGLGDVRGRASRPSSPGSRTWTSGATSSSGRRRRRPKSGSASSASTSGSRTPTSASASRSTTRPGTTTCERTSSGSTPSCSKGTIRSHDFGHLDGIVVPGGFGYRGVEGMVQAARYAREHQVPYLGLCLGLQVMVIELARHRLGLDDANSSRVQPVQPRPGHRHPAGAEGRLREGRHDAPGRLPVPARRGNARIGRVPAERSSSSVTVTATS